MRSLAALVALLPLAALASNPVTGGDTLDAASVRAPFLVRTVGARAAGMGEAFTAVADDASAALGNTGGLAQVRHFDAVLQYEAGLEGASYNTAAAALPLGPGTLGLGLVQFNGGEYEVRDANGILGAPESFSDIGIAAGYALPFPKSFGVPGFWGLGVEAVAEGVGGMALGVNVGAVAPLNNGFSAGLAAQHLGPKADGFGLPASARLGLGYAWPGLLRAGLDARIGLADGVTVIGAGLEVVPVAAIAVRAGYQLPLADQGLSGLAGVTAGAGFRMGVLTLDYAFQPYGELATTHRISLSLHRGPWVPAAVVAAPGEPGAGPATLNVAVMDLEPQNVSAGDAAVVSDMLRNELIKTGRATIIERQNMQKILAEHALQQTGCTSEDCAVKLGKLLNVQRMVAGSLGKLGKEYFVNVRIVDIETGKAIASESTRAKDVGDLARQMPGLAQRLSKKLK